MASDDDRARGKERKGSRSSEADALGLNRDITRRDFVGGTLLGTGIALLGLPAPLELGRANAAEAASPQQLFDGYGGVGDYARSNGNVWSVMDAAHGIRDGRYQTLSQVTDTTEVYDLVCIGGGAAGLSGMHYFRSLHRPSGTCLLLENHPIFGGEAKRNEFDVDGYRLTGPQGSNTWFFPKRSGEEKGTYFERAAARYAEMYAELTGLGLPDDFTYQALDPKREQLVFDRTNYMFMWPCDVMESVGYYYPQLPAGKRWVKNPWGHNLDGTPYTEGVKKAFYRCRNEDFRPHDAADLHQWLDTMTYEDYLTKVLGLSPEIARYYDPCIATALGLGAGTLSACAAHDVFFPGFRAYKDHPIVESRDFLKLLPYYNTHCFPGGNSTVGRFIAKNLMLDSIEGKRDLDGVQNGRVRFDLLDRAGEQVRIRLESTVVRVEHEGAPDNADFVRVTYLKGGKLYSVRARTALLASGGWVNRRIVTDMPEPMKAAYQTFQHSSQLVANVALTNWRFLYKRGMTACRWFDGEFGFTCNIRPPMVVGHNTPPLDPDKPIVLTFYVPYVYAGLPAEAQCIKGRAELMGTSYVELETRLRRQLAAMFADSGFDPKNDIAGIVLNRWGHAFVVPEPGFYHGVNGKEPVRDVIRRGFGRIGFAHSELLGTQGFTGAMSEAKRAVGELVKRL